MTSISDMIRGKQFRLALRGYAVDEVDAFLDQLVVTLAADALAVDGWSAVGDDPAATAALRILRHAEQTADGLLSEAAAEAEAIIAAARAQADELLSATHDEVAKHRDEAVLQQRRDIQALERRHRELCAETERLTELEHAQREQLEAVLRQQLRQLSRSAIEGNAPDTAAA